MKPVVASRILEVAENCVVNAAEISKKLWIRENLYHYFQCNIVNFLKLIEVSNYAWMFAFDRSVDTNENGTPW